MITTIENDWHKQMVKTLPVPVILTNAADDLLLLNAQAEELLVYSNSDLEGKNIVSIIRPAAGGAANKDIEGLIAMASAWHAGKEFIARRGDGTAFYMEITATPVPTSSGMLYSWVMLPVMKDKRVLKERIKELNTILFVTEELFKNGDPEESLQECLHVIKGGWQNPDHMGVRIKLQDGREYKTDNFRETEWRLASSLERSGQSTVSVEVCFVEPLPDANMIFLPEEKNLINGVAKLLNLYLDQWHALNKVKESEAHLKKITQHIPGNIYQFMMYDDGSQRVLYASKGLGEPNNHIDVEALRRDTTAALRNIIHPDDHESYYGCLMESHRTGKDISVQYRTLVDGVTTWRWMWAQAEKQPNGDVVWYGCTKDITTIIEYVDVLEQIVFDISHIIRRPVTTMLGITELINKMSYDEQAIKMFASDLKKIAAEMDQFTKKLNVDYSEKMSNMPALKIGHQLVNSNQVVNKRTEFFTIMDAAD